MNKPIIIAEIGGNHLGQVNIAMKMIEIASKFASVDVVKFQKRNNRELFTEEEYNSPHPNPVNSYGKTYGEHRDFLEFDIQTHLKLKKHCEKNNVEYSCSVWDIISAKEIIKLAPKILKIPSAHNLDFPLLETITNFYDGEIHVSTGMTNKDELEEIVSFFKSSKKLSNLVLYYCVSSYPAEDKDLCLLEIRNFIQKYGNEMLSIGFSGHHKGIAIDIAALTLGAKYFERHFTLDRTFKGTDHAASLEPDGLRKLVRDLNDVNICLKEWNGKFSEDERFQRNKLKKIRSII